MSVAKCRFMYNNLADISTIATSSVGTGFVTGSIKYGTGTATLSAYGAYSYDGDLEYTVEIDSVVGGSEIGQSTFRWKTNISVGWEAQGVLTSSLPISLNNGIILRLTSNTGVDFVISDTWYFKGINRYSTPRIHDYDRDTGYRSSSVASPVNLVFNFGSAQPFNTLIIDDHNLTASATITFQGNATDSWGAPSFSESVTYASGKITHYTSALQTYKYARAVITDTSNPDGYISIKNIFIGQYMELSRTVGMQFDRAMELAMTSETNRYMIERFRFHGKRQTIKGRFDYLTVADKVKLDAMLAHIGDTDNETLQPIYFNLDSLRPSETWMMTMTTFPFSHQFNRNADLYSFDLMLKEVAISA